MSSRNEQSDAEQPHPATPRSAGARLLFGLAIVGSAFLIFLVQPMVAKRIVPWFGGTPAVWTLCLAFYQTALFLGYAYAHALIRWAPPSLQVPVHAALLLGAALSLPILPSLDWATSDLSAPSRRILQLLSIEVALPFIALAATGPLVQAWFARRYADRSPYFLYALSNAGSLAALLAYPFWIEPRWPLSAAGVGWGAGFVAVALAIFGCAWLARQPDTSAPLELDVQDPPQRGDILLWLLLPGAAVVVLMGVSNELCLDLASIPFLWVLPLAIYLSTFILCFSSERWYVRKSLIAVVLVMLAIDVGTELTQHPLGLGTRPVDPAYSLVGFQCLLLFASCMIFHGELYRRTPAPRYLTAFYLCLSGGGALGGLFVGLLSPRLFDGYPETVIGLALGGIGVAISVWRHERGALGSAVMRPALIGLVTVLVSVQLWSSLRLQEGTIWRERSFFGVLRVQEFGNGPGAYRRLMPGSAMHGTQLGAEPVRGLPTSYFGRATALGALMSIREATPLRIGIIGLGVGTIASYGRARDFVRYYEIDPAVARIASAGGYFSFLEDSEAGIEVALGDARLELEREREAGTRQEFDILIVDAFSSDSIPAHLMTIEAFEVYRRALSKDGLIAVHCTNRHLTLMNVISRVGRGVGLQSLQVSTRVAPKHQSQGAEWVFLSPRVERLRRIKAGVGELHAQLGLEPPSFSAVLVKPAALAKVSLWTDDYTDLLGALRPR
jgi:hypothetical protein